MKEFTSDVLIVGSGLVGLVAAHSLSSLNYRVILVDRKNLSNNKIPFSDTRTVAVSQGSKRFLENLSLWSFLEKYAEPIKNIKVYNRSSKNKILFKNEIKNQNLGYVIKNKNFSKILIDRLKKYKNTKILYGFNLSNLDLQETKTVAFSNNKIVKSKIIIAADGKNSNIRRLVGNKTFRKKYEESALVLNFSHQRKLFNTAYEIFYKTGPLAILPMHSPTGFPQSTLIWSNSEMFLKKLINCEDFFIKSFIEEKIENLVGGIKKIKSKQIFSLSAHINDSFINNRLVYIGDSAHSIHPIAGQGWNLGVNDVKNLYEISKDSNIELGSELFCKSYNDKSYHKAFQLYQLTDKLNSHFMKSGNLFRSFTNIGFELIEKNNFLKNKITNYAMGI